MNIMYFELLSITISNECGFKYLSVNSKEVKGKCIFIR